MTLLLVLGGSGPGVTAVAPTATIAVGGQTPTASNSIAPVIVAAPTAVVSISALVPGASPGIAPVVRSVDAALVTLSGANPAVVMTPPPQLITAPTATIAISGSVPVGLARAPYAEPSAGVTIIGAGSTAPIDSIVAEFESSIVKVERWLDIYEADNVTLWRGQVGMTAGSVTVDMGRDERRNIDVTLFDADDNIPYGPGGLWYDKILKPYRGIKLANGDVFVVPLGEFMIDTCSRPHFPGTIQCGGRDFTKKLKLAKFAQTTTFSAGMSTVEVIRAICVNAGITKLNFIASVGVLTEDVSFERGAERWEAAKGLAESINCELFFDASGYLTLRNFVDPLTAPVSFTFNNTNLVDFTRSSNDSLLYNHVVVYGDGPDNPLVYGEAENNNYASPTSIAQLGRRTYTRASQFVVDNFQAQQIAESLLRVMALEQFDMSLTTIVVPWLEAGDAIQVIAPAATDVDPARYLLSNFTIPLELAEMSGSAKRITIVQIPNAYRDPPTYPEGPPPPPPPPPSTGNVGYPATAVVTISAVTPVVTANSATSISETFSAGTTAADANFTQVRGPLNITSGRLRSGATTTEIDWFHNTNLTTSNHWVEADVVLGASDPGQHWTAVVARSNGATTAGSAFEVSGRNIVDLNGRKFVPVGLNVTAQPSSPTGWWATNMYYANGHVDEAVSWGLNVVRAYLAYDIYTPEGAPTLAEALAGMDSLIAEYTAQGIVVMVVAPPVAANPTVLSLPSYVTAVQDHIVANHKSNPFVWLNMMGEAFTGTANWAEVNDYLYNRARQQGWNGVQVFTLGGNGRGLAVAASGTFYDNWRSGKSNVVFDFHNYGLNGTYDEISQTMSQFLNRGNALIVGEFGEHWDRANGGPSFGPHDPVGVQWVNDNAWTTTFGVGGIAWQGGGNHLNPYSMRLNPTKHADTASENPSISLSDYGRAFWHTDTARSYVGSMIYDRGQYGSAVNGGGRAMSGGATGGLTYYALEVSSTRDAVALNKCIDGIYTELGCWSGTGWALSSTHKLRLEVFGSLITGIVDGVSRIQVEDTSISSGTRVGVHLYAGSDVTTHQIDNFAAGTLSSPTPPPVGNATAPGAPTSVTATPYNGAAVINWAAPSNTGNSPLTDYEVWRGVTTIIPNTPTTASFYTSFDSTSGAAPNILDETYEGRGTSVVNGTLITAANTLARAPGGTSAPGTSATTGRFFYGGTGIFNQQISQAALSVHPRSAAIVNTLANGSNDRGVTTEAYAMSVVDVDPTGDTYQVIIMNDSIYNGSWGGSGQWGFNNITYLYPTIKIKPGAQVPSGTDQSFIIRDWANDRALSFWITTIDEVNKRILAHWGGAFPANSDGNSMAPNYSAGPYQQTTPINRATGAGAVYGHTAVGISGYQGVITFDDLQRGYINHALVFATKMIAGPPQSNGSAFFYPATTNDGNEYGNDRIEAGSRIQLTCSDATINAISHAGQRMIARALKDYGAYVVDYAGAMMTYPVQRPRQGNAAEAALYTQYGFSVSGDGWNPLNEIPWSQMQVLVPSGVSSGIPAAGYYVWDAGDKYNAAPNNDVKPQFSSIRKNGSWSARFALQQVPAHPTSWGGSFFHYALPSPQANLYFNTWFRFDQAMANGIAAGATPALFHIRTDYGGTQLNYLRLDTSRRLSWQRSGSGTWTYGSAVLSPDTWYKVECTFDAVAGTARVIVKNEAGTTLQELTGPFDSVSAIGFIEWGALWCDLSKFPTRGHMWFDDTQMSSSPISSGSGGAGTAASGYGLAETPPNGLHGYNIPLYISGGAARPASGFYSTGLDYGDCIAFPAQNDIGADQFARAKIRVGSVGIGSNGVGAYTGVMVRVTPTSGTGHPNTAYSWYKFETVADPYRVRFLEIINGGLGHEQYYDYPPGIWAGQVYEFELSITGANLVGKINNVTIFSRYEDRLTNGKPGLSMFNRSAADQTVAEDFAAGSLTASSPGGGTPQTSWTLVNDGVGVGTGFTDTGLSNGTQYSYKIRAKNAAGVSGDSNVVTVTPQSSLGNPPSTPPPEPPPPVDPPPVSTGDWYITNAKIGRNGKQFIPIGLNGVAAPRSAPAGDWWNDTGMGNMRGRSAYFVQLGFNFLRINDMADYGSYSAQDYMNGIFDVIDEYTARGVVCMPAYHKQGPGTNPSPAQMDGNQDFQWFWTQIINRYEGNKLVWVNPLNEPIGTAWDQFETLGNYQYNLMRSKGWTGPVVIDLPQWGGAVSVAASRGAAFMSGKYRCILAFHNYSHVTDDVAIVNAQAQGVALINGEFGETLGGADRVSSDWTIDNAIRLGTGAVFWWGAGNRNDNYVLRTAVGSTFYDTHLGLSRVGQRFFNLAATKPPPADL